MMRDNTSQTRESHLEVPLMKALGTATRTQHARLNQLILTQLPLALPPHAESPEPYAQGLLQIAAIYHAFESSWQILSDYEPVSELPLDTAVVLSSLIHLYIPNLSRTERLNDDLSLLLGIPRSDIAYQLRHPASAATSKFINHIRDTARNRPHALIAYSWVLYMALFNGGRWIREQLATARDISWCSGSADIASAVEKDDIAGLRFWHFDGGDDGDALKNDFKTRLAEVGSMLSTEHREDIVDEASTIFEQCAVIVQELASPPPSSIQHAESRKWLPLEFLNLLLPVFIMQLLLILVKRIAGARIRAPLPFRRMDRRND